MLKNKRSPWAAMWALIRQNAWYFTGGAISTTINILIGFLTPAVLAELFDHYLSDLPSRLPAAVNNVLYQIMGSHENIKNNLWIFGVAIVLINLLKGLFAYFKGFWCAIGSENAAKTLRDKIYTHVQALPFSYHVKASTGDLLQRCTTDIEMVRRFLNVQLMSILNSILLIVIALVLMLPINSKITFISMVPLPFMLIFSWRFFKVVIKAYRNTETAEGKMSNVLQENITGIRVVRAFGRQQDEVEKFERANADHRAAGLKAAPLDAIYWSSGDFFSALQGLIVISFCVYEAVAGRISTGDMLILVSYSGMLLGPTRQLGRVLSFTGRCMVSLSRILEVLREKEEPEEPNAKKPDLSGDIVFDNVSFSYDNQKVLDKLSFTIKGGETVAILGATGSGKSTVLHMLQRLYEPNEGKITIGGVDINDIDRMWLRSRVGLILQEPFLYSRTIKENIAIANTGSTDDAIDAVAHTASAYNFINESEKGYDTLVGERGVTLSGGQKQRVAIARTLLKNNSILIFDDSLSAVDTQTDRAIRTALKKHGEKLTTIIVSHRISTLSEADRIFVLENGRISQQGTHDELIKQGGLYARISNIQAGNMEEVL
ncbi:MAG: ABC transporter ATP-binding protein [Eubacteriales bacterium]|nr:ABC transporter ATP-binding protein [Eubacteriales bacterium]